jgi:hypothetical protein
MNIGIERAREMSRRRSVLETKEICQIVKMSPFRHILKKAGNCRLTMRCFETTRDIAEYINVHTVVCVFACPRLSAIESFHNLVGSGSKPAGVWCVGTIFWVRLLHCTD